MKRLNRAEQQERTRAAVLTAAREEFTARGYRDAKVDSIAERAGLTRGAVYSNFPGKRALYFAVLAEAAEHPAEVPHAEPGNTPADALGALARAWVAGLPLADAGPDGARLGTALLPEVLADERTRRSYAQLTSLNATLLGLSLEALQPVGAPPARMVRVAAAALTTLHGAGQMAAAAPGFLEPFDIVRACEQLAALDLGDHWRPPAISPPPQAADARWDPPPAVDLVRGDPARLAGDGVIAVLGLHRAGHAEHALRAAPPGARVTAVLVTSDPAELDPLARLTIADLATRLRRAVPARAWPRLQVVTDPSGALAAAAGVHPIADDTTTAVRVTSGRITTRAEGLGAGHSAATASVRA